MTFERRQIAFGAALTVIPLLIVGATLFVTSRHAQQAAHSGTVSLARADLDHVAELTYLTSEAAVKEMERRIAGAMKTASWLLARRGQFTEDPSRRVSWQARNQVTSEVKTTALPAFRLGHEALVQNFDPRKPSPAVDEVQTALGVRATIFQRMNDAGDMLRVSTNVIGSDGRRAIGTFIAASAPDGTPNRLIAAVLRGETFIGRAFVVNGWYLTAYEPIVSKGRVIGMSFTGIPEKESVDALLDKLAAITIGKSGHIAILRGTGDARGTFLLSPGRKQDGVSAWQAKDLDGRPFIQQIVTDAVKLEAAGTGDARYRVAGAADAAAHVVRFKYFPTWDWVIAATVPEAEFLATSNEVARLNRRSTVVLVALTLLSAVAAVALWGGVSRRLARRVTSQVGDLREGARQVLAASGHVAAAAQSMSQGATEQAASLEEMSASMEEMSATTRQNADNSQHAAGLMDGVADRVRVSNDALVGMVASMDAIEDSSQRVSRIIKTIDEIAFQTNLLALNAAVEAARAGEAGMGFAVVADEVRSLAQRSASAAKDTATLIEESLSRSQVGTAKVSEVAGAFKVITEGVDRVQQLVSEVSSSSRQQAAGIRQVADGIAQMEKVTQATAAMAEESAAASEELNAQADVTMGAVHEIDRLIGGGPAERAPGARKQRTAAGPAAPRPRVHGVTKTRATSYVAPIRPDAENGIGASTGASPATGPVSETGRGSRTA